MRKAQMCILAVTLACGTALADDGAASIAAGGIVLMRRELRIVMAKEVLQISTSQVVVDYEFRNNSDEDITLPVAFPVPPYKYGDSEEVFGDPGFDDFQLYVNGMRKRFSIETRSFVGKREITALLARERVDGASFGHIDMHNGFGGASPDVERSGAAGRARLIAAGALKDGEPQWRVEKKYYWTQTFPARETVHIQHRYSPVLGGTNSVRYGLEREKLKKQHLRSDEKYTIDEIKSLCLEPSLKKSLLALSQRNDMTIPFNYVDFILTTANTWKTPIEDFTLIVTRPNQDKPLVTKLPASARSNETLVSFCWDGPIEKTDATHFKAHVTDFVPKKELRVGFVYVDQTNPVSY